MDQEQQLLLFDDDLHSQLEQPLLLSTSSSSSSSSSSSLDGIESQSNNQQPAGDGEDDVTNDDDDPSTSNCSDVLRRENDDDGVVDFGESSPTTTIVTTSKAMIFGGRVLLLCCAIMYASLNVCFRYLYSIPRPPSISSLMAVRGWTTYLSFLPLTMIINMISSCTKKKEQRQTQMQRSPSSLSLPLMESHDDDDHNADSVDNNNEDDGNANHTELQSSCSTSSVRRVALELCFWNYTSQVLCTIGLLYIPSARVSFLGQVSVVIVPILESFHCFGGNTLPKVVLLGCITSFIGLLCLSYEDVFHTTTTTNNSHDDESNLTSNKDDLSNQMGLGDVLVLCSTICWSFYILRISSTASHYDKIQLQGWKNFYLAIGYTLWYVVDALITKWNEPMDPEEEEGANASFIVTAVLGTTVTTTAATTTNTVVPKWFTNPWTWVVILYSSIGPGTTADIFQQYGQQYVPGGATESNLILSMEPVFTTIISRILLGETTTVLDKVGGGFLIFGAIIASLSTST